MATETPQDRRRCYGYVPALTPNYLVIEMVEHLTSKGWKILSHMGIAECPSEASAKMIVESLEKTKLTY